MTIKKILHTIDRSFDPGNRENFILNEFLMVISIFLLFLAGMEIMHKFFWIIIPSETLKTFHQIEFAFGVIFLIEFFFRTIYVYIPDKAFFRPYPFVTILVILTLLAPQIFNFAFLRLIWVVKMFKIYHLRRESIKQIVENPQVAISQKTG